MSMKSLLRLAAALESVTGVVAFLSPAAVAFWLFGEEVSAGGSALGRVAGIALIALAVACWPHRETPVEKTSVWAMFTYSLLVALFLGYQGVIHSPGALLWVAVAIHVVFLILFAAAWSREGPSIAGQQKRFA
jgi:hypothetical protein